MSHDPETCHKIVRIENRLRNAACVLYRTKPVANAKEKLRLHGTSCPLWSCSGSRSVWLSGIFFEREDSISSHDLIVLSLYQTISTLECSKIYERAPLYQGYFSSGRGRGARPVNFATL